MLSSLWNVLIWKSLFTYVLEVDMPYLDSSTIVMSSGMHGDVLFWQDYFDLKLVTSINSKNDSASSMHVLNVRT